MPPTVTVGRGEFCDASSRRLTLRFAPAPVLALVYSFCHFRFAEKAGARLEETRPETSQGLRRDQPHAVRNHTKLPRRLERSGDPASGTKDSNQKAQQWARGLGCQSLTIIDNAANLEIGIG